MLGSTQNDIRTTRIDASDISSNNYYVVLRVEKILVLHYFTGAAVSCNRSGSVHIHCGERHRTSRFSEGDNTMVNQPDMKILARDIIQKTWIPEGSVEYDIFKLKTRENDDLVHVIKKHVQLGPNDWVLDVGGRDGNVTFRVQDASHVDIVDPDPFIQPLQEPNRFWRDKVQHVEFDPERKYKLIICCHVMGYLGLQGTQEVVVEKLLEQLVEGGVLLLFYNTNHGYMQELLQYSRHIQFGHYDYFDTSILQAYKTPDFDIKHLDRSYTLDYGDWLKLARMCWFLFGAMEIDVDSVAKKFLPKLTYDLVEPTFEIDERMTLITRRASEILFPTLTR